MKKNNELTKTKRGTVISVTPKTLTVVVTHGFEHPIYKKVTKRRKSYAVYYEGSDIHVGDSVLIRETRPISKNKHFTVVV